MVYDKYSNRCLDQPNSLALALATMGVSLFFSVSAIRSMQQRRFQGTDMEPTLRDGDRLFLTSKTGQLRRGDIVVFEYSADRSQTFVKRVIALPGEEIEIRNGEAMVDGNPLQEDYVDSHLNQFPFNMYPRRIPEGKYFVMGDNRDNSNDSRLWGPLSGSLIHSKVLFHF